MSFLFSPFFILPMILVGWTQLRVRSAFKKYSQIASTARLSGAETARRILREQGIYDVAVEETSGSLSDHYDPRTKVVRLSSDNFHGHHLAGLAVAAHEVGHAIQHAQGYLPLIVRHAILPVEFNASSRAMAILSQGYLAGDEVSSAKRVLNAAAMTYVAAAATAVLQLVHMFFLRGDD